MKIDYKIQCLEQLEAESIHIFREAVATCSNPVMLYSIGKDSSVLLHLAKKAFLPGKIPFPLLHVDTGFKFPEMITFRDNTAKTLGTKLIVEKNESAEAKKLGAKDAHTEYYIYHKKTKPLLDGLERGGFAAAFGGARRDEEKSRAKERVFSLRDKGNTWNPKNQRPELWHLYNTFMKKEQSMRIFPLSNWTELDIWLYILKENIDIVPLYFACEREVVNRNGITVRVDEFTQPKEGEEVKNIWCRYRTLGCAPSTGVVESRATTVEDIVKEVFEAAQSERVNRAIDYEGESSMEKKKKEGYF